MCAAHIDLFEQRTRDRGLRGLERASIALGDAGSHDRIAHARHDAADIGKVEIDQAGNGDQIADPLRRLVENIVRHAEKLTSAPGAMTESDLGELRAVGLDDKDILDITLIVAYFNFVNRIALGLGVDYSADEVAGYKND